MVEGTLLAHEVLRSRCSSHTVRSTGKDDTSPSVVTSYVTFDSVTFALMCAGRDVQQDEKAIWNAKRRKNPELYGPYADSG